MREPILFALLGLGTGGLYALTASGLVLIYRGSGVLNFAQGAIALGAATLFYELRWLHDWPTALAFAAACLAAGLVGVATHVVVMRPLAGSSPLARLMATLGLMALIQKLIEERIGVAPQFVESSLPSGSVEVLDGVRLGIDRLIILCIALVLTAVLAALYRFTRFGLATSAVAENERLLSAMGWSPNFVAAVNWGLGSVLAALAGILLVPITGLASGNVTVLVMPALAAALIGSFRSFPLTLLGALFIGITESEMARYVTTPGWAATLPFLVIVVLLVVRGRALPLRSHQVERLPGVGGLHLRPLAVALAGAGGVVLIMTASRVWVDAMTTSLIFAVVGVSVVVVSGFCGQLSIAQFGLAGVGAFVSARLADAQGLAFPLAVLAGVAVTVVVGAVFALPALRTRGVNLAIATIGLALAVEHVLLGNLDWTGGTAGTRVGTPELFGLEVGSINDPRRYALVALGAVLLAGMCAANIRRGSTGRRLLAVRGNERAAAALGISVFGAKLYSFAVGAGIAALGGALFAFRNPTVDFREFDVFKSITIVLLTTIGGVGYVAGAVVGGVMVAHGLADRFVAEVLGIDRAFDLLGGALLIATLQTNPDGLVAGATQLVARARRRLGRSPERRAVEARGAVGSSNGTTARQPVRPQTLVVRSVGVEFGGVRALDDASVVLRPGEVVGIIGGNGAGKTTLIDVVTGFVAPARGGVYLGDRCINGWSPAQRARAGIGRSFQSLELFEDMTVYENIRTASDPVSRGAYVRDLVRPRQQPLSPAGRAAIEEFDLGAALDRLPSELSHGQRRLVAIARAVATQPSVLLLDEPAAGLNDAESRELGHLVRRLGDQWGMAVGLVEHDMALVMSISDRIVVFDFGAVIGEGSPDEIRSSADVLAAYMGAYEGAARAGARVD